MQDDNGHDFAFNVCGNAASSCLPKGWDNTYQTGVAIELWGNAPVCDPNDPTTMTCVDKRTHYPRCCTRDCQVLGVGVPSFRLTDATDADGGVELRFQGSVHAVWRMMAVGAFHFSHHVVFCVLVLDFVLLVTQCASISRRSVLVSMEPVDGSAIPTNHDVPRRV